MITRYPWLHDSQEWLADELDGVQRRAGRCAGKEPGPAFNCDSSFDVLVKLDEVQTPAGRRPFRRDAADSIAAALLDGVRLPPLQVSDLASERRARPGFRWVLIDGFHRFHVAGALSLQELPAILMEITTHPTLPPDFPVVRRKWI